MERSSLPIAVGLLCLALAAVKTDSLAAPDIPRPLSLGDAATRQSLSPRNATLSEQPGAVRISFAKVDWPAVWFKAGTSYASTDWTRVGGVLFEVANPEKEPITVNVRIDDSELADGQVHVRTGSATVSAGERAQLVFPLEVADLGMRGAPPLETVPGARRLTGGGQKLDYANIVAFQIFLARPDRPRTLDLISVRWLPKPDVTGIVDRFGQYAKADWPGKLKSEDELKARIAEENRWNAAHPPASDRDEYGGWKNGPALRATGFFRTVLMENGREVDAATGQPLKAGQRWWLVTPSGHLFWSAGVDCVRPESSGPIKGRESLFTWLPEGAEKAGYVDFYRVNLQRKYGEAWQQEWSAAVSKRLPAWGFNTIGNWSQIDLVKGTRVPYTRSISTGGLPYISAQEYQHTPGPAHRLPDYFDERFPGIVDAAVVKGTSDTNADPWCLGYFVDNELAWDSWAQMGRGGEYVVAREAIGAKPDLAARKAFVEILRRRYGTPEKWEAAWGVDVKSWDDPVSLTSAKMNDASRADAAAFMTAIAERYFSVVRAAMKKHAPNQLYLGPRFAIRPQEVVSVASRYCDVVSFNIYDYTVKPEVWKFTETLGKPIVIGEFHFGATDRGMFHTGLRATQSQAERAEAYATYVRSVLELPSFVGCHWFQYADQALTGRFDGENYNIGFVTITDTPYPELRQSARDVNNAIYETLSRKR